MSLRFNPGAACILRLAPGIPNVCASLAGTQERRRQPILPSESYRDTHQDNANRHHDQACYPWRESGMTPEKEPTHE